MKIERRYLHFFRSRATAAAAVLILAGTITAGAATVNLWSSGILDTLKATPDQQQELTGKGMTAGTETDLSELAVTDHGVTITPKTVIVDERTALFSFQVKGTRITDGMLFNSRVYLDADKGRKSEDGSSFSSLSYEAGFRGNDHEYVVSASPWNGTNLLGKTVHITLSDLETAGEHPKTKVKGKWHFTITLPKKSANRHMEIETKLTGSDFTVDSIDISPISIQVDYSSRKAHIFHEKVQTEPPQFLGVVLKDGTRKTLANGGTSGYEDASARTAQDQFTFSQVIDPDQVKALLIYPQGPDVKGAKAVEVPLGK